MDEITLSTKTVVSELKDGIVETYEIVPEDFGFKTVDLAELQGRNGRRKCRDYPCNPLRGRAGSKT